MILEIDNIIYADPREYNIICHLVGTSNYIDTYHWLIYTCHVKRGPENIVGTPKFRSAHAYVYIPTLIQFTLVLIRIIHWLLILTR